MGFDLSLMFMPSSPGPLSRRASEGEPAHLTMEMPLVRRSGVGLSLVLGAGAAFGPTGQEPDRTHGYANYQQRADTQGATAQIGSCFFF
ncbi:hypothetical protein Hgul01_04178 [Herpetosiphon gulosus]|uniref:Uncharacterized protein n=1 Tax=Herpetosiphon gulosus TaxID=1973496 RepID=A0ABP9X4T2_9CHLR